MQTICAEVKKNKQLTFYLHQMWSPFFRKSLIINLMSVIMCAHIDKIKITYTT